jgi:hypothetical protein
MSKSLALAARHMWRVRGSTQTQEYQFDIRAAWRSLARVPEAHVAAVGQADARRIVSHVTALCDVPELVLAMGRW